MLASWVCPYQLSHQDAGPPEAPACLLSRHLFCILATILPIILETFLCFAVCAWSSALLASCYNCIILVIQLRL